MKLYERSGYLFVEFCLVAEELARDQISRGMNKMGRLAESNASVLGHNKKFVYKNSKFVPKTAFLD